MKKSSLDYTRVQRNNELVVSADDGGSGFTHHAAMKAWIIRWSWIGDHAAVEQPIVAVLRARTSAETVRKHVELLYVAQQCLRDQIDMARYNKPRENPYPAEFAEKRGDVITCGHNPYLEAFLADDVQVIVSEEGAEELIYKRRKPPIKAHQAIARESDESNAASVGSKLGTLQPQQVPRLMKSAAVLDTQSGEFGIYVCIEPPGAARQELVGI
ncbi:hypothetical protein ACW9UR_06715 [Halovulum sp. GXIMD14794]